jgi:predicted nucleotidyltransferase
MKNFEIKDYEKHFCGIGTEYIQKLLRVISSLMPDAKIILYGSRARGDCRDNSDIDIALDAGEKIPGNILVEVQEVVATLTMTHKVDIVDFASARGTFREAILHDGVYLKS